MIETDILIVGAGPVGLFTVFEAGLIKLKCHIIDVLPQVGGQLTEIYPKKPIYDIPGYPTVLAHELIDNLMLQIAPFKPGFTLGERAESISKLEDGRFELVTNKGTVHRAHAIAIAGGLGCFEPRKPPISNIDQYEDKGVAYFVKNPEIFRDKRIVIAGGGDSALDWTNFLVDVASEIILVHRRQSFRGALDSVEKVMHLAETGRIKLVTDSEVVGLNGENHLEQVVINHQTEGEKLFDADWFIPLFGLTPKLGPIENWGLGLNKGAITVNTFDYSTNVPGIYAIGDVNDYPGKLKLILCGFHEATLMVQSVFKLINPDAKLNLKYTTVNGIQGF